MNKDIKIAGATYSGVPAIKIPAPDGGTVRYTEVSDTTATAADVASGKVFYDASGNKATGTGSGSSGGEDSMYDIFFKTDPIDLTDDNFPAAEPGTLIMSYGMRNIRSIVSSKIGSIGAHTFDGTWAGAINADELNDLENVNLPELTEIGRYAFYYCYNLKNIALPKLKIITAYSLSRCNSVLTADFSSVDTVERQAIDNFATYRRNSDIAPLLTFPALKTIRSSGFCNVGSTNYLLKKVVFPAVETIDSSGINSMHAETVDFGEKLVKVGDTFFGGYGTLNIIIRAATPPTASSTRVFNNINPKAKIYVPDDSVDVYKAATNWSNYADKFQPLSTYVEDAT